MSDDIKNAPPGLYWKLVILELILESLVPLTGAIVIALDEKDWSTLSGQGKFVICLMIFGVWADKVKPILKDAAKRIRTGQPLDETIIITKNTDTGP